MYSVFVCAEREREGCRARTPSTYILYLFLYRYRSIVASYLVQFALPSARDVNKMCHIDTDCTLVRRRAADTVVLWNSHARAFEFDSYSGWSVRNGDIMDVYKWKNETNAHTHRHQALLFSPSSWWSLSWNITFASARLPAPRSWNMQYILCLSIFSLLPPLSFCSTLFSPCPYFVPRFILFFSRCKWRRAVLNDNKLRHTDSVGTIFFRCSLLLISAFLVLCPRMCATRAQRNGRRMNNSSFINKASEEILIFSFIRGICPNDNSVPCRAVPLLVHSTVQRIGCFGRRSRTNAFFHIRCMRSWRRWRYIFSPLYPKCVTYVRFVYSSQVHRN